MTPEDVLKELKASIIEFQNSEDWGRMTRIYGGNYVEGWDDALDWIKDEILRLEEK